MEIDWSDIEPTERDRGAVERALGGLLDAAREKVLFRRRGSGYEARVILELCDRTTSLKLHAESFAEVVDRLAELVRIVVAQRSGDAASGQR